MGKTLRGPRRRRVLLFGAGCAAVLAVLAFVEERDSYLQSWVCARYASGLRFHVGAGPSPADSVFFPDHGPFAERRGFTRIPALVDSLARRGFEVTAQARSSERMIGLHRRGIPPVYPEKPQASLDLRDLRGRPFYRVSYPERVYGSFEEIPDVLVRTLLFIENRELGDPGHRYHNPAVEWDRFVKAAVDQVLERVGIGSASGGGSTLATQIEKFRWSPEGRTRDAREKLRQMTAASLRAYLDGRETLGRRRGIVLDYINSVPLSAAPGYGEVVGLGDGLWAWFDTGFGQFNRTLGRDAAALQADPEAARLFKQALALFVAQRRPTAYLVAERGRLDADVERYIRLLAREGILDPGFRDAALAAPLEFRTTPPAPTRPPYLERKAANAVRVRLRRMLGLRDLYELDRIDLTARTTLDAPVQSQVTRLLTDLSRPAVAESLGLVGPRLLSRGDPAGVVYSFTLYEATPGGNRLRVQADNYDRPLDINEGVRLDLGSTAKLRALVTYLEILAAVQAEHGGRDRRELMRDAASAPDPLSRWALEYLGTAADTSATALLEAAMRRRYSASPEEQFFTGGGAHRFVNFDSAHDGQVLSVTEAFRHSVNLVFIRLMRDVVRHYETRIPGFDPAVYRDPQHPLRREYLARFADREGREFLLGFHREYAAGPAGSRLDRLADKAHRRASSLAALFRYAAPAADADSLGRFLDRRLGKGAPGSERVRSLYDQYAPGRFGLEDRAFTAGVHPLELWLVGWLADHEGAGRSAMLAAGAEARQESYGWLFRSGSLDKQNRRIRILVEEDAFGLIHEDWRRLGYPFTTLTPSYASAIGSSADRPAALADLVGILLCGGVKRGAVRLEELHFAAGTPFETALAYRGEPEERVLPEAVARVAREALRDVVENGTGRRVRTAVRLADGTVVPVGGKTGTGDHRFERFDRAGNVIESRVVSRSGTFVFFLGDRFYGNVTVFVEGEKAGGYAFTSALPAQLLVALAPALEPLFE